jgi:hypothetical protein
VTEITRTDKLEEIIADCGSVVISTISARGNRSNHPIGRAFDLQGNPGCIYAHLKGWPGGYSLTTTPSPTTMSATIPAVRNGGFALHISITVVIERHAIPAGVCRATF